MGVNTLSAREFNQKVGKAKTLAKDGPVFVTDRGQKTHVLLSFEEYQKITKRGTKGRSLYDALYDPRLALVDPDFEFPRIDGPFEPAEFD